LGSGTAGSYTLQLAADSAAKPGTNTWTISSNSRVKNIIGPYSRGLSDIVALEPKLYRLNGKYGSVDDGKEHVSIIAQDILDLWPSMLGQYTGRQLDEDGNIDQVDLYNLNTHELQWAVVNALKEIKRRLDDAGI
jgi:hypothetical protein